MYDGFHLHYDGGKLGPHSPFFSTESHKKHVPLSATKTMALCFSRIGALAIRLHNAQSQKSDLIQGIVDRNYLLHPVESTAKGGDQKDTFSTSFCPALSARLASIALSPLGKGKLLSEKGRRLLHVNKTNFHGEQNLWEKIHSAVWHTGISFARELTNQGFAYVCCPSEATPSDYETIHQQLSLGNFSIKESKIIVGGFHLPTESLAQFYTASPSIIQLDPELTKTFQPNGMMITLSNQDRPAPLGWIIHKKQQKIMPQWLVEDSIRIIRLAKGGYHELSPAEQKLLAIGPQNSLGAFTQSPVFNALYIICNYLEQECGFDPQKLLGNAIHTSYNQVQHFFKKQENVEDFLTGVLLTEMLQPLKVTRSNSIRKRELPLRLTYPFQTLKNTYKAIAYAYDLQYKNTPLLQFESITQDANLPDVSVNGTLALPSLSFAKQSAAILATSLLVGEQWLLEQILRDSVHNEKTKLLQEYLENIMLDPTQSKELTHQLMDFCQSLPSNEFGPILGLQFEYCDPIITVLREATGFDILIKLVEKLETPDALTDEALTEFAAEHPKELLDQALENLYKLGQLIQQDTLSGVESEGSKGILAGLRPLIKKISPSLASSLTLELEEIQLPSFHPRIRKSTPLGYSVATFVIFACIGMFMALNYSGLLEVIPVLRKKDS